MIVRDRPGLLALFFILRGSVLPMIFPQVLFVFGLSALVILAHRFWPALVPGFNSAPLALVGIALSIFLGFRNNACYDRWWEARKHWGQLVIAVRSLARQSLILEGRMLDGEPVARRRLLELAIAFSYTLLIHLRPGGDHGRILLRLPKERHVAFLESRNRPDFILREMGGLTARLKATGALSDIEYSVLESSLHEMSSVLSACERIRFTPVPFGYTLLLHRTAYIFCFLLPFGFADVLGWLTPFATALVAYTFFGLDALGDELEEPFGDLPNDLPIGAIAETIEINLREALGEKDLPPLPEPKGFILM
ncbi:bestrophin family protein [Rhizobium sp. S95]|uniref:Bestrophin family protein n=1 Tax=Ciceribacter sichuanensis TaxID=2949647 RepID=A0AAJ1BSC0_9HYPH|nr:MULTISPECIES: bestrophin family protein [unclassified Ciceribacter]MCM2395028.1 bestrophin family protein [Ciceribacter sp. S95]MCM2402858.1 bestrophin family protein [Ciceribacter sp. S153]MCO5955450.1 bestrophin family protein [Ciceribacter sp. S101]